MADLSKRDKHTVRFIKWIREHSGLWYLICTPDEEHMSYDMMRKLIEMLAEEQFYEIIFVLLMVYRDTAFMKDTYKYMLLDMVLSAWKGEVKEKDEMLKNLTDILT